MRTGVISPGGFPAIPDAVSQMQQVQALTAANGPSAGVSVTAWGIFPNTGLIMNELIQRAIEDASDRDICGLVFPGGDYLIDETEQIFVPSHFSIEGLYGATNFVVLGSDFTDRATFPMVSQAVFAVARVKNDPAHTVDGVTTNGYRRGNRYGYEQSRRTIGTGAIFTVTASGGAATAVTATTAGSDYLLGDRIDLPNGTRVYVNALTGTGISTVSLERAGSGWGSTSNTGQVQTNTTGQNPSDRIFDLDSFADEVHFRNLKFTCGYGRGETPLTGTKGYNGIDARGVLNFSCIGCIFNGFPETGLYAFDVKNARIEGNWAGDCGWTGVLGRSRNGFSNIGLHSISQPSINTEHWIFERNVGRSNCDVGAQFTNVENFRVVGNVMLGNGTIGIEGEAASFNCWLTYAGSNGVKPPGSGVISDNIVDGLMLDGALAPETTGSVSYVSIYAFNGITWAQGNEGTIREGRNYITNHLNCALKITRNSGGRIIGMGGTVIRNCGQADNAAASPVPIGYAGTTHATGASSAAASQVVFLSAIEVVWKNNEVTGTYRGVPVYVSASLGGFLSAVVTDNIVDGASIGSAPGIQFRMTRSNSSGRFLDFSRNRGEGYQNEAMLIEVANSGNTASFSYIRTDGCNFRNANRANLAANTVIRVRTTGGANLNYSTLSVDGLQYYESSVSSNAMTQVVTIENSNTFGAGAVSVSNMMAPQFATKYSVAGITPTAPSATRFVNNV